MYEWAAAAGITHALCACIINHITQPSGAMWVVRSSGVAAACTPTIA
jgi:hypothetical protein